METEPNKNAIRRMIEDGFNRRIDSVFEEIASGDLLAEIVDLHAKLTASFPDLHVQIEDLIAEDDKVVARLTFAGTHSKAFRGIAATGRAVEFTAIRIYRFANGKIAEMWANIDVFGLMQQLGAIKTESESS